MNYTYMLRCKNGSLYTGWTNNIEKRLQAHNNGTGAKYTKANGPVTLVWLKEFETKQEAMQYEAKIKKLKKLEKELLVKEYQENK